jgi:hypothetical protein
MVLRKVQNYKNNDIYFRDSENLSIFRIAVHKIPHNLSL